MLKSDPNWSRWIFASVSKYFDDNKGDVFLFVEGTDRSTAKEKSFAEFRMNGPFIREITRGNWQIDIDINILVSVTLDDEDSHKIHRIIGQMMTAFTDSINVFRLGDSVQDTQKYLGCLLIRTDSREQISVFHFGQIKPDIRLIHSSIVAGYRMMLPDN